MPVKQTISVIKPKARIPVPQKPPKVEKNKKAYTRKKKHPANPDIAEGDKI
jgi:hypothetical protein